MDKQRQKDLGKWLKLQNKIIKKYQLANVLLGSLGAVITVLQMFIIAMILHNLIVIQKYPEHFYMLLILLFLTFIVKAVLISLRERLSFYAGEKVRAHLRSQLLTKMEQIGALGLGQKASGSWSVLMVEQIENLHNYYARYIPQQKLAAVIPTIILCVVFYVNWAVGVILLFTMPLLPIFMALVGMKTAEINQQHINILARLSGQFLDKLQGFETIRLFHQGKKQTEHIYKSSEEFRQSTMDILKYAFLNAAVLEFFSSVFIAITAVYFGFIYLGQLDFGYYGSAGVSLFTGFFCLMLAPEFYQPLRDLGTFYHDKTAAMGAADSLEAFLSQENNDIISGQKKIDFSKITIEAQNLQILSTQNQPLTKELNFTIEGKQKVALIGESGAGKSSFLNLLLGFLPYQGSLKINGIEFKELDIEDFRNNIAWVGQNPKLMAGSILENLTLGCDNANLEQINTALQHANALDFVNELSLDYEIKEGNIGLSGGQAQRIAIARAILKNSPLLFIDEPTASLDLDSGNKVLESLTHLMENKTTFMITHHLDHLQKCDHIIMMEKGDIIASGDYPSLQKNEVFQLLIAKFKEL